MTLDPNNTGAGETHEGGADYMPTEGTSMPVAQPIEIMTSGDPNHTAVDANDSADGQKVM